jgi:adenine specific DNA methylase Mod
MKAFTSRLQLVSCSPGDKESRTSKMTPQEVTLLPGDCLSVFHRLAEHQERIDCILIDPPYNTGNPRLPYRDCRSDGEWYDFIYPRLAAGYPFLSNRGCIAVHINDKQLGSLLRIMEEIFGKRNQLYLTPWQAGKSGTVRKLTRENFDTVKPVEVEKLLLEYLCPADGLVLDFFAGTGTTGHAVLALNR